MNHTVTPIPVTALQVPVTYQAENDNQLIGLWLHGKAGTTQEAYVLEIGRLRTFLAKPLQLVTLGDLQAYMDSLAHLSLPAQARAVRVVKSLLSFTHRLGYLPFNVGLVVKAPKVKDALAERIMTEAQVQALVAMEPNPRNKALLRVLYYGGLRCSELCGLRWRDIRPQQDGRGQISVMGKGGKTRVVVLPAVAWADLLQLRGDAGGEDPVFRSRKGSHLDQTAVLRLVRAAAGRAGIEGNVSPHWLRHCHASLATTSSYCHARPGDGAGLYLSV